MNKKKRCINSLPLCQLLGERVVGRGSDLYQLCKDIDDTIKGNFSTSAAF